MTTDKAEMNASSHGDQQKNNSRNGKDANLEAQHSLQPIVEPLNLEELEYEEDFIEDDPEVLNLSHKQLEKLSRARPEWQLNATTLILDHNNLQRIDNIHTFQCIEKLSVQHNKLLRMFQVAKLSHLKILNLSHNSIVSMEGLKELKLLTWLSLASNHIKGIENLNRNVHMEHLDISDNVIPCLADLSFMKNLKTLLVHKNQITTLRASDRFLPPGLSTLTLNDNKISELTDMSFLADLTSVEQLTIANNPCVTQPEDEKLQFDYRPYVINWCLSIRVLDGLLVGAKESLKAEWMYSQSKGRQFTDGQHKQLLEYLVQTCPLHPGKDWQEDQKLNLILSKVQEHQSSLKTQPGCSSTLPRASPLICKSRNSGEYRRNSSVENSPRLSSRASQDLSTPTRRISSARPSRTSPSPMRRNRSSEAHSRQSYSISLPRTLYADDGLSVMSQSMQPEHFSNQGFLSDDVMTGSCDPAMLNMMAKSYHGDAWMGDNPNQFQHRPRKLYSGAVSDGDLQLEDFSDGEMMQSMSRSLHPPVLNPVPESLNSPDVQPTKLPKQRDDPLLYHHEMATSLNAQRQHIQKKNTQALMSKSVTIPMKRNQIPNNGYGSSGEVEASRRQSYKIQNQTPSKQTTSRSSSISNDPSPRKYDSLSNKKVAELKKTPTNMRKRQRTSNSRQEVEESSLSESEPDHANHLIKQSGIAKSTSVSRGYDSDTSKGLRRQPEIKRTNSLRKSSDNYSPQRYAAEAKSRSGNKNSRPGSAPTAVKRPTSAARSSVSPKPLPSSNSIPNRMTQSATTIQKTWKGHQTRNKDEKVKDLKQEIRSIRTEEHIKYLTKELQGAKQALEQERKLRSLQMDAIKVLWKEVQMMDATKGENPTKPKPSGSFGSKISSRSSEHSIAKLMETLEATASNLQVQTSESKEEHEEERKPDTEDKESVKALGETCKSLQGQVEQLQSSLHGMMRFMSAMNTNMEIINHNNMVSAQRTRHSSSASGTQDSSFQFYAGPGSLPPSMFNSVVHPAEPHYRQQQQQIQKEFASMDPNLDFSSGAATDVWSKSCDSLTQTDVSVNFTPTNESKQPFFLKQQQKNQHQQQELQELHQKLQQHEEQLQQHQSQPKESNVESESESSCKSSASQRPTTLPGLNEPKKAPPKVAPESPKAPSQVKAFAKSLVDGLLVDTITKSLSETDLNDPKEETDISLSLAQDLEDGGPAIPDPGNRKSPFLDEISQSSHIETDSLEEAHQVQPKSPSKA